MIYLHFSLSHHNFLRMGSYFSFCVLLMKLLGIRNFTVTNFKHRLENMLKCQKRYILFSYDFIQIPVLKVFDLKSFWCLEFNAKEEAIRVESIVWFILVCIKELCWRCISLSLANFPHWGETVVRHGTCLPGVASNKQLDRHRVFIILFLSVVLSNLKYSLVDS